MHVAIPLYPRFTALDAVGPYTVFAFARAGESRSSPPSRDRSPTTPAA
jgi:hypothetical protein